MCDDRSHQSSIPSNAFPRPPSVTWPGDGTRGPSLTRRTPRLAPLSFHGASLTNVLVPSMLEFSVYRVFQLERPLFGGSLVGPQGRGQGLACHRPPQIRAG